jgi:uncharacterized membrane protein
MAEKRLVQVGYWTMSVLAIGVALFSVRYAATFGDLWLGIDPKIRALIETHPFEALGHMLVAPIALFVGPWQFLPGLRAHHPPLHRLLGRLYVLACTVAGVAGFLTALPATGGPVAGIGFALLAVLWVGTTLWAWRAAVARNFPLHRLLMRFSYAMTFGAVTLRLQIPIGLALGFPNYPAMSVWLAYTSWIPNVVIVAIVRVWGASRRNAPMRSPA